MNKGEKIFDGNEKQVFATDDKDKVIFRYKDVTMAFNGIKRARFIGKGILTNKISSTLLNQLNANGINTHFIERLNDREQLCRKIEIIPLEFIVHNRIAGPLAQMLGVEEGYKHDNVIVDIRYNNDELGDPYINEHHAAALGLADYSEIEFMNQVALDANKTLTPIFSAAGMELIELKLEFGRASDNGEIIISDEISPDTCRIWDVASGEKLDKDRFRYDLSDVVASYKTVYERLKPWEK